MTLPPWHEEPIAKSHLRQEFDCGDSDLNEFVRRYARQSHEQNAAKTFCAIDDTRPGRILGFYTIAPVSFEHEHVPNVLTKGLARHPVPGFRLARLATDLTVHGNGLGSQLFVAAALRCLRVIDDVGGVLFVIDAKNQRAASWYASFGAVPLVDSPLTLVMPLIVFRAELARKGLL